MLFLKETLTHQSPFMFFVPLISLHNIRSCAIGIWGLYTFAVLSIICHQGLPKQICRSEHALCLISLNIFGRGFFSLRHSYFFNLSPFAIASHLQDVPILYKIKVWEKFVCRASKALNIQMNTTFLSPIYSQMWSSDSQVIFSVLWPVNKIT